MPGSPQYPSDRVAQKSYESGGVQQGNTPKDVQGKEEVKTERCGDHK